jgi:transcriptional regulator with XRE-family HTH domain
MNLIEAFYFIKKFFNYSNEELADHLGISRQQVSKIIAGHKGLNASVLKRISSITRISMDELMHNDFLPPSYHFSKHIYSTFFKCDRDYPEFFIMQDDSLYIRPFTHDISKIGQLIMVWHNKSYVIEKYNGDPEYYLAQGKAVHYHIIGQSRFLYRPIEDVEYQKKLIKELEEHKKESYKQKRGRPIKIVKSAQK